MVLEWWQVEKWQKITFCAKLPLFSNPLTNGQSHSIKCSTTNMLRYAQALIYIAKSLVVVVASGQF